MTRTEHLQHAIRRLIREEQPINLETVGTRIPAEIARDMTDDELVRAHAEVEGIELSSAQVAEQEAPVELSLTESERLTDIEFPGLVPRSLKKIGAPRADQTAQPSIPPTNTTTEAEAIAAVKAAQKFVSDCRGAVQQRTHELQEARTALHKQVRAYLATGEQYTPLAAARDFQHTATLQRQARKDAGLSPTSETANRFLRKQMKGGGNMHGAFPSSWRGRTAPGYTPESK